MIDPAQLSSAFLSGPTLTEADVDRTADLIPYLWYDPVNDRYIPATITPLALYEAMTQ